MFQNRIRMIQCRIGALLLLAALLLALLLSALPPLQAAAVEAPSASNIYIYNTYAIDTQESYATIYILTTGTDRSASYRVYTGTAAQKTLLAEAKHDPYGNYCAIRLPDAQRASTTMMVTKVTAAGESAVTAIKFGAILDPRVEMKLSRINTAQPLPMTAGEDLSFKQEAVDINAATLQAGAYYQLEVRLRDFVALDAATIPLHYNTAYLKPATVQFTSGDLYIKEPSESYLNTARNGTVFNVEATSMANRHYGIMMGYNLNTWVRNGTAAHFAASSAGGSYQYINTTTGLIKLEAGNELPAPASDVQVVRIFFQATQDVSLTEPLVWYATEQDCPEAERGAQGGLKYYDLASPYGVSTTLGGANVLAPPLVLETVNACDETTPVTLQTAGLSALPASYYQAVNAAQKTATESTLGAVQVYNYTNSDNAGDYEDPNVLDGQVQDQMILQPCTAIKAGDVIKVYKDSNGSKTLVGETTVLNSDEPIKIGLGWKRLDAAGGTLYVSALRTGQESDLTTVAYRKEVRRNVNFRICRSSWSEDTTPVALSSSFWKDHPLKLGEQVQLRIYFNDIYDLMSYALCLRYNPDLLQVADASYTPVPTGAVLEEDYRAGKSCLSVGKDLADVTFTEQMAYQASQRGNAEEIAQLKQQMGLTDEAFEALVESVEFRYSVTEGDGSLPWKGGLAFTGARPGDLANSALPYVDNEKGYLQLLSAALTKSTNLEREGDGYHFLSINFIATGNGDPQLRLAQASNTQDVTDGAYCPAIPDGAEVVLADTDGSIAVTEHWYAQSMGSDVEMALHDGNALAADDGAPAAVYLYDGAAYADPGATVTLPDGTVVNTEGITRYYYEADQTQADKVALPDYASDEALTQFRIAPGKMSAHYKLLYTYTAQSGRMCQLTRDVFVIYRKGDVNGDGNVDLFDEQALADHLNGTRELNLDDECYKNKTVDVTGDGTIDTADREAIRRNNLGAGSITQDY